MSFSEVPPSTNVLNGYNDAGEAAANVQIQAEATAKAEAKAAKAATKEVTASKTTISPDQIHGIGESTAVAPFASVDTSHTPTGGIPTNNSHSYDPVYGGIIPVLILLLALWMFWKFMVHSIKKNPPYGGYAHKHKRMHPGVMKPRVFKHN